MVCTQVITLDQNTREAAKTMEGEMQCNHPEHRTSAPKNHAAWAHQMCAISAMHMQNALALHGRSYWTRPPAFVARPS